LRKLIPAFLALLVLVAGLAAPAATKKKSSGKKETTATSSTKTGAAKTSSSKKKKGSKNSAQTWRSRQLQPTPERYKEIQDALIAKGYLKSTATGKWDVESTDALRRFQSDQKLEPTGKIDSLSLIALGLGPKYDTAGAAATRAAPPSPVPAQPSTQPPPP
jgi:hypothetical protein